jgi:hypothetical protein
MGLKKIELEGMDQWRTLVGVVLKLWAPRKAENFDYELLKIYHAQWFWSFGKLLHHIS